MSREESDSPVKLRIAICDLADAAYYVADAEKRLEKAHADKQSTEFIQNAENDLAKVLIRFERAKAALVRWTDTWKRWEAIEESLRHGVSRRWAIDSVSYAPKTLEMH